MLSISVPRSMLGKVIGHQGATKKDIESDYGVEITLPPRENNANESELCDVIVRGPNKASVENARTRILDICGVRVESNAVVSLRAKIDSTRKRKDELFQEANQAPRGPNRDALFTQAHQAKDQVEKLEKDLARAVFADRNQGYGLDQMDLHGLYVDDAVLFVKERLSAVDANLKSGSLDKLTIITGAGHHSGKDGPKIRPAIISLLKEQGYPYVEDETGGQLFVQARAPPQGWTAGPTQPSQPSYDPIGDFFASLSEFFATCLGLRPAAPSRHL